MGMNFAEFPFFEFISLTNLTGALLAHGAGATLAGIGLGGLGLSHTLGKDLSVLVLIHQLANPGVHPRKQQ